MKKYILASVLVLGCGARSGVDLDIGTLEERLVSDDNFGVQANTLNQCNPGSTGVCLYPPGFGDGNFTDGIPYAWRVCIDFPTLSGVAQVQKASAALGVVVNSLSANGVDIESVGCASSPNIVIKAAGGTATAPADKIKGYIFPICTLSTPLTELPSISGTHKYCEKWEFQISMNAIDANFSSVIEPHIYRHALGASLGAATVGSGLHEASAWSSFWSYNPTVPIGKSGFVSNDYCRARARYDAFGQYTQLTKDDNSCD